MKIKTCEFIELSDIMPPDWDDIFWTKVQHEGPFDDCRSLVRACDYKMHCRMCLEEAIENNEEGLPHKDVDLFMEKLEGLGTTYIDLEN